MARLTLMQQRFCEEYIIDGHGTYAAIRAGSKTRCAHVTASKWLKMGKIRDRIDELRAEASQKSGVSLERTLAELGKIAFVDPAEMFTADGGLKNVKDMPAHVRGAIAAVEQDEIKIEDMTIGTVKKVKLVPKEKALDMIMRHLGQYEKDNKQKQPIVEVIVDIVDDDEDNPAAGPASEEDDSEFIDE